MVIEIMSRLTRCGFDCPPFNHEALTIEFSYSAFFVCNSQVDTSTFKNSQLF